MSETIRV